MCRVESSKPRWRVRPAHWRTGALAQRENQARANSTLLLDLRLGSAAGPAVAAKAKAEKRESGGIAYDQILLANPAKAGTPSDAGAGFGLSPDDGRR